jgi:hypothetical protein
VIDGGKSVMRAGLAIAVAAALAAGTVPAVAGQGMGHGAPGGPLMERLDLDGDGAIDREEARAFGDRRFEEWDRKGDGAVTEAEMIEAIQARIARRFGRMFARLDENGDGRLERAELAAGGTALFDRIDADGDGRVSIEEVRAGWLAGRRDGRNATSSQN